MSWVNTRSPKNCGKRALVFGLPSSWIQLSWENAGLDLLYVPRNVFLCRRQPVWTFVCDYLNKNTCAGKFVGSCLDCVVFWGIQLSPCQTLVEKELVWATQFWRNTGQVEHIFEETDRHDRGQPRASWTRVLWRQYCQAFLRKIARVILHSLQSLVSLAPTLQTASLFLLLPVHLSSPCIFSLIIVHIHKIDGFNF